MSMALDMLAYAGCMNAALEFQEFVEDRYIELGLNDGKWSQARFAKLVGVTQPAVSGWFQGVRPSRVHCRAIARVLQVQPSEIYWRVGYPVRDYHSEEG